MQIERSTQKVGSEAALPWVWLQQSPQGLAQRPPPCGGVFLSLEAGLRGGGQCGVPHGRQLLSFGASK